MCGFVGILAPRGAVADASALAAMTNLQAHRGPDDEGYSFFNLHDASAGFGEARASGGVGFRRLSIQDLSPAGHQPMVSDSGRCAIVFNGEIYNAPELRRQMLAAGTRFRGTSDTEVILKLYELAGDGFLNSLNGMFAFALIDLSQQRVLLARDRVGIKPLYYTRCGETLLFGSELKSFLAFPGFRAELDEKRFDEYVQFRYCAGEGTMLRNVKQLRPGHVMIVRADGSTQQSSYWSLPAGTRRGASESAATERLEAALETSVRAQLLADVDVGCQLSGGIDSSLVNLFAARHASAGMEAFSVTLEDARFSEAPWITDAARKAGVHSNSYQLNADDFIGELDRASWHLDQPINHPNSLGLLFLTKHASQHVKVLLSGEGADEIMGGYPRFFHARLRRMIRPLIPALAVAPGVGVAIQRRLGAATTDSARFWIEASGRLSRARAESIVGRPLDDSASAERLSLFERTSGVDYLTRCMNYETSTYLVDLLIRQDKMTMAHSVENRVPFLDHELIETIRGTFCSSSLVGGGMATARRVAQGTKRPLKSISKKYFGDEFTYRTKSGFAIPLKEFFGHARMRQRVEDELIPGIQRRGVFAANAIRDSWRALDRASTEDLDVLWSAFSFELWARLFLDDAVKVNVAR